MKTIIKQPLKFCVIALLCSIALASCTRNQPVAVPSFKVTVDSTNYAVNTPITFKFTGDADVITFYSGATGAQYQYRNRLTVSGTPQMQFNTTYANGPESGTLHLLISKDFNNLFDAPDVQAATWTDITSRAKLATNTTSTASGVVDLSDIATGDDPVNIAFRYTAKDTTTARPTWTVTSIAINNKQSDNSLVSIATSANINWGAVIASGTQGWSFNTTTLTMVGTGIGTPNNDSWCITQPLQMDRVTRDIGVAVKASATTVQKSYVFTGYTTPGTYLVTFEAINANAWSKQTTTQQFTITVH
jgi:hypothetical protein